MTEAKFVKRKKPNYVRAIILLVILILVIFLFYNVETLFSFLFEVKE
jgi:lipopolysaccharide export LptBFGC system permease protein LptF